MEKYDFKDGVLTFKEGTIFIDIDACDGIDDEQIKKIVLPQGVRAIDEAAFRCFQNLVSVEIPDSLQVIGNNAFYGCHSLDEPTLKRVEEITKSQVIDKEKAFQFVYYSDYYDEDWIEENLFEDGKFNEDCDTKRLEEELLSLINKLEKGKIGPDDEVKGIDLGRPGLYIQNVKKQLYAFVWKGILVIRHEHQKQSYEGFEVNNGVAILAEGIKEIPAKAFMDDEELQTLIIPEETHEISVGHSAFRDCKNLQNIQIQDTILLFDVDMNDRVDLPLRGTALCEDKKNWEDGVLYVGKNLLKADPDVVKGEYYVKEGTKSIAPRAFECCKLEKIHLPESIEVIGRNAFECTPLLENAANWEKKLLYIDNYLVACDKKTIKKANIKEGTKLIADWVFEGSKVAEVIIPDSIKSLGDYAFDECEKLASIVIPDSVQSIGYRAFCDCESLADITIPDSIKVISQEAFVRCENLTSIVIPNSVTKIGAAAFIGTGLTSIVIPDGVIEIEHGAFKRCEQLTSVTIGKNVQHIGANVFEDCKNLQNITLPDSVVSIGEDAFMDIPNVIYTGSAPGSPWGARNLNGYVDGDMIYNDASETVLLSCHPAVQGEVVIPESVKIIGEKAFYRCKHITSVIVPDGVTEIGECAFGICFELSSINIPNTLEVIGKDAFYSCSKLDQATRNRIAQISNN